MTTLTEREVVTGLARMVDSDGWKVARAWYRRALAERMLDAKDSASRDKLALMYEAAADFMLSVENEVTKKSGAIDGRAKRYKPAGVGRSGAASGRDG
jgi:hypothetical protein